MQSDNARDPGAIDNVSRLQGSVTLYGEIVGELPHRRALVAAWAAAAATHALAHSAMALAAGGLAHAVVGGTTARSLPILVTRNVTPLEIASLGLVAAAFKAVSGYFLTYAERRIAGHVVQRSRLRAADDLLAGGARGPAPSVLARVATRTAELGDALLRGPIASVRATIQLLPLAVCLALISPPLAAIAAVAMVAFAALSSRVRRRWRASSGRAQGDAEVLHGEVNELVENVSLWRTYGAGRTIRSAIARAGDVVARADARVAANRAALSGANEVFAAAALVAAVAFGAPEVRGELLAFAAVFFMAYRPLRDLGDAGAWISHGQAALEALGALGDAELAESEPDDGPDWRHEEPVILAGFGASRRGPKHTLHLEGGSVVLLRGPTGAGKTTLLLALLGLEPSTGSLRYGSKDLSRAGVGPLARPFAWVPQDAPLITASLEDNVALAAPDPETARGAIELVGAEILRREVGDDLVGPGGRPLSGGQRRLVALARAVATGLPVLLLDEPTEGLDPTATAQVLEAIRRLRRTRTVLVSSHRAELEGVADRVVDLGRAALLAAE